MEGGGGGGGGGGWREGRVESKRGEKMREGLNPGIKISELFFPPLSPCHIPIVLKIFGNVN